MSEEPVRIEVRRKEEDICTKYDHANACIGFSGSPRECCWHKGVGCTSKCDIRVASDYLYKNVPSNFTKDTFLALSTQFPWGYNYTLLSTPYETAIHDYKLMMYDEECYDRLFEDWYRNERTYHVPGVLRNYARRIEKALRRGSNLSEKEEKWFNEEIVRMHILFLDNAKIIIGESVIPKEIYLEIFATFSMHVLNAGYEESAKYKTHLEFIGVELPNEYIFRSDWCEELAPGESTKLNVEVLLPEDAIPPDKDEAIYEIKVILEAK